MIGGGEGLREHAQQVPSRWRRLGRLFPREGMEMPSWMGQYAALPYPVASETGSLVRVYFSGRDARNRASIGAVTVDLETLRIVEGSMTEEPLLAPGVLGAFDDSGCTVACVIPRGEELYLYYTGWMLGQTVPFYFAVGLAVSTDGGRTFRRLSPAPILDRHPLDPYLCASPSILVENGTWRMWYVSGQRWEPRPEGPRHHYFLRYAESKDGIHWQRAPEVALDFSGPEEYAIGRPHVIRHRDRYFMWYCFRGDSYRIGFADSNDGRRWTRRDQAMSIVPTPRGWDGEMQAYPHVFFRDGRWWLLYNGNGYGATGFGIADGISTGKD